MDSDDMYCPPDWWIEEREFFEQCELCGHWYHINQPYCYKCLPIEAKWKLGVL